MSADAAAATAPSRFWLTRQFWAPPLFPAGAWYFALSTAAAAVLALYVAYYLELDNPGSAMTTVLIISSPLPGMVLSKGIWRLIGTIIGAVMSVALIAIAAQAPALFMVWLAAWVAVCTFVASYLRYFRAYAAVLAGYTLSMVALPAIDHPDQVFSIATSRLAVVTIGVLSISLVKGMLALGVGPVRIRPALRAALLQTAQFAADALELIPDMPARRRALVDKLNALDPLVQAAAAESAEAAMQAPAVRLLVIILLKIATLAGGMYEELAAAEAAGTLPRPLARARDAIRDLHRELADADRLISAEAVDWIATTRALLAEMSAELAGELCHERNPTALQNLALAIRFEDILEEFAGARELLITIESGKSGRDITPISYHRDTPQALINASRAFIAALCGCAFWVLTAWPTGATMLTGLIPIAALLGTTDRPDIAALGFLRGVALAGVVAFPTIFFALTQIEGYPLLALVLSVVIIIGALYQTLPKHAGSATAFMIFFSTFVSPTNPQRYDPAGTLNTISAILLGSVFAIFAFRLLWPVVPEQVARRVMRDIVHDLEALCRRNDLPSITQWESRMADRVGRLGTRLAASPHRLAAIEGGLAAAHAGREVMRSRRIRAHLHLPQDLLDDIARARAANRKVAADPDHAAALTAIAAKNLLDAAITASHDTGAPRLPPAEASEALRVAAALQAVSQLLTRHRAFFHLTLLDEPVPPAHPTPAEAA